MASLADSLVSSAERILSVYARTDLEAKRATYLGRGYWIVKDPIGLKYYRFQDEEYFILESLDGTKSLETIKDEFEAKFPPQKITLEEIQSFVGQLHQCSLIVVGVPDQGHELLNAARNDAARRFSPPARTSWRFDSKASIRTGFRQAAPVRALVLPSGYVDLLPDPHGVRALADRHAVRPFPLETSGIPTVFRRATCSCWGSSFSLQRSCTSSVMGSRAKS